MINHNKSRFIICGVQKMICTTLNSMTSKVMKSSQITRLSIIAVIATSLLAVGVVAAISMAEEADARNRLRQSNSATVSQNSNGGSNSATVSQSNSASQSNGGPPRGGGGD
jgi:hypothetical protein